VLDPFLFDSRGYDVIRSAVDPVAIAKANAAIDALDVWDRIHQGAHESPRGRWTRTTDDLVRYRCVIGTGHVQVGPVIAWPEPIAGLVCHPVVLSVLAELFPEGHYVDHASLSLAHAGSPGVALHGGGHERDLRQGYRLVGGSWDIGLSIVMISLVDSPKRNGGTALVPGSHKANFAPSRVAPTPEEFDVSDWVSGVTLNAGDLLVFPEALMHGAFPWRNPWERRILIVKAYPVHISNLNSRMRSGSEPFWSGD